MDAFRLDTVAWMRPEFWRAFTAALRPDKKDFFIFGEIWTNADYKLLGGYWFVEGELPLRPSLIRRRRGARRYDRADYVDHE